MIILMTVWFRLRIGFVVELESEALGKYRFNCFGEKGGVKDMELWETGETVEN